MIPGVLAPQTIADLFYGLQALKAHQVPHPELAPVAFIGLKPRVQKSQRIKAGAPRPGGGAPLALGDGKLPVLSLFLMGATLLLATAADTAELAASIMELILFSLREWAARLRRAREAVSRPLRPPRPTAAQLLRSENGVKFREAAVSAAGRLAT